MIEASTTRRLSTPWTLIRHRSAPRLVAGPIRKHLPGDIRLPRWRAKSNNSSSVCTSAQATFHVRNSEFGAEQGPHQAQSGEGDPLSPLQPDSWLYDGMVADLERPHAQSPNSPGGLSSATGHAGVVKNVDLTFHVTPGGTGWTASSGRGRFTTMVGHNASTLGMPNTHLATSERKAGQRAASLIVTIVARPRGHTHRIVAGSRQRQIEQHERYPSCLSSPGPPGELQYLQN